MNNLLLVINTCENYFKYSKLKKQITLISHNEIENINFKKYKL